MSRWSCSRLWWVALTAWLCTGCGKELGRQRFDTPEQRTFKATLEAGEDVAFWVTLDVEYVQPFQLAFDVKLLQEGKQVAATRCDARDIDLKMMSTSMTVNERHTERYDGRMKCNARVPKSGPTEIQASVALAGMPEKMTKLELFVKQ